MDSHRTVCYEGREYGPLANYPEPTARSPLSNKQQKPIKCVGVLAKYKPGSQVQEILGGLVQWLQDRNIRPILEEEIGELVEHADRLPRADLPAAVDLLIVLGGDGTLLSVGRLVINRNIPILGVNLGTLGFLAEVSIREMYPALERILRGEYAIDHRMMLKARVYRQGSCIGDYRVLNDVVVNKGALARIISLEVVVDGSYLTTFQADGLILSTPTGSTAYSLSAGGPIIYPSLSSILLTPICPHTLTNRPIILPVNSILEITLKNDQRDVLLTLDGQVGSSFLKDDVAVIQQSEYTVPFIKSPFKDYFEVLRTKLKWGER